MQKLHKLYLAAVIALAAGSVPAAGNAPQPSICTRACWGASAASGITNMSSLTRAIVHHTAGSEFNTTSFEASKAYVRGIQNLHKNNGWGDIGYHFLVDKFGNIFEGRAGSMSSLPRGAHDGTNTNSFGFNVMGYFHPNVNNVPTAAMMNSLYAVIAWRMPNGWSPYGSPGVYGPLGNNVGRIDSHRRVKSTACPGDHVHNPYIGNDVNAGVIRAEVQARINGVPQDRYDVFVRGTDNGLWHRYYQGGWSAWINLGGIITSDPAVCSWGSGRLDVFARGANNNLYHRYYQNGWGPWENLGGVLNGAPDCASWGPNRIDIVARGTDNALYHMYWAGAWSAWAGLGNNLTSDPTICSWGSGRLDIFARGADNGLQHMAWSGTWSSWENLGGNLGSGPDATCWGPGRIDIVYRGAGGNAEHLYWAGAWSAVENLGGNFQADLSAASWGPSRLDVFGGGVDGHLYHRYYWGGYSAWMDLGGGMIGGPDACSWSNPITR